MERRERLLEGLKGEEELEATLERAAQFLVDLPAAWRAATEEEQNQLARLLFEEVRINDDWVAAVKAQPSLARFFDWDCQARGLSGGSDRDRLREIDAVTPPLVPILYSYQVLRTVRRSGTGRYSPSANRTSISQEYWPVIVERSGREGLRQIARDFGVSHETIRSVLRRAKLLDLPSSN